MANNVIYLPPGVVPPSQPMPTQAVPGPTGIPFDRAFFEKVLPQAIQAFCSQAECDMPRVELLTVDGAKHFINGISGVSDAWVALSVAEEDHPQPIQVFIPYQTIFRVEVHPEGDKQRGHLGFVLTSDGQAPTPVLPAPASEAKEPPARKPSKKAAARAKK